MEKKIHLLSADWCVKCPVVKNMLEAQGIEYVNVNVDNDPEIAASVGAMSIPTIVDNTSGEMKIYTGQQACLQFINE